jgi:hypothetical protein
MVVGESKTTDDEERWKKIPVEIQVEVDTAIDHGNKPSAVNHLMCANVGFTLSTALKFVERRKNDLPKQILNKTI